MNIANIFELFFLLARGGGGGSSGGGGGSYGGGGSSSSSTDGPVLGYLFITGTTIFIGYVLGYKISKIFSKYMKLYNPIAGSAVLLSVMTLLIAAALIATSSKSFIIDAFFVLAIVSLWFGWYGAHFAKIPSETRLWMLVRSKLKKARSKDKIWNEKTMIDHAKKTFIRFQQDWSLLNSNNMVSYVHQDYMIRTKLLMQALSELHRLNKMQDIKIYNIEIVDLTDSQINSNDTYQVIISASATDSIYDTDVGKTIFTDNSRFAEKWTFSRNSDTWLLQNIDQETADVSSQSNALQQFAIANKMVYSLDMGWLLLPTRGQLFSKASFGTSDINNHIIGLKGAILMQLYQYRPELNKPKIWLIGQINVPKQYGHILVRPMPSTISKVFKGTNTPQGTAKYNYEWQDFNRKFEVFATDNDRLASFELINPGFMAYMYDLDENIILEVVDNIIYFAVDSDIDVKKYELLLALLSKAHKELRL